MPDSRHPLESFAYCPKCGGREFVDHNRKSKRCSDCGFTYYLNPSAAVALLVTDTEGALLVATRGKEPALGTLDLPGGFVDADETGEEAAARELREETGLEISLDRVHYWRSLPNHYLYSGLDIPTLDLFYHVELDESHPIVSAMDDVAELAWLPLADIDPARFGLPSIRRAVELYLLLSE